MCICMCVCACLHVSVNRHASWPQATPQHVMPGNWMCVIASVSVRASCAGMRNGDPLHLEPGKRARVN